ncbi:uncharacterized protein LOC135828237 [Sycon ciliatum]|uniref:uncharacterized protein LOC135828237 n=1 Tax=Sycon ciliatum TaxID=27933 RepID=UPI0031F6B9E1
MAYATMSSRCWTASFAFATLAVICTQDVTADSDRPYLLLPNFVTNCNNSDGTQSTWFAVFSTSPFVGLFNTNSPESAVDTCQRYGFDVMDYDQYKNPGFGVESCVSSLLDRLFSIRGEIVSPVYWARRSGNVLMRQDYSQESSGVAYTGHIPPTIICSGSWTTVPYQKYYLSTLQNGLRVKYNAARRACAFYGKRLMSENDIPASQLTNLRQNVFAHLQVKSGAYFLEGGAKILAQNYRGQTSELIMQIFNLYPQSEKQILCIQICEHGYIVKGRCICQAGYIGETCEKKKSSDLLAKLHKEGLWKVKVGRAQSGPYSLATLPRGVKVSYEFAGDACAYINHTLLTPQELAAAFQYDATLRASLDDLLVPGVGLDHLYILAGGQVKAYYKPISGPSYVIFLTTVTGEEGYSVLCGRGNFAALTQAH